MTLYQKFIELTGLLHISEVDFNAAMDPKTDAQKALRGFIGWSIGKTDTNADAALFRKTIDYKYAEKVDNYTAVTNLSNFGDTPSVAAPSTVPTIKPATDDHVNTVPDEHKNDVTTPSIVPSVVPVADTHTDTVMPEASTSVAPATDTDHKVSEAPATSAEDHKETVAVPSTVPSVAPVADTHTDGETTGSTSSETVAVPSVVPVAETTTVKPVTDNVVSTSTGTETADSTSPVAETTTVKPTTDTHTDTETAGSVSPETVAVPTADNVVSEASTSVAPVVDNTVSTEHTESANAASASPVTESTTVKPVADNVVSTDGVVSTGNVASTEHSTLEVH